MTAWDITGVGAVANLGNRADEVFDALCAGRDGRSPLQAFHADKYRVKHAYEILDRREPGRDEPLRASRWLTNVVAQALADASLSEDLSAVPVLVGTTMREQRSVELWWRDGAPFELADLDFAGVLRRRFGAVISYTFANACSASLYALGLASDLIELGVSDTVVVAGTDSITESAFGTMDRVQTETPQELRPFDVSHRGMLMGEGAAAVVLQRSGTGLARARARLRGVGMNCDAHHATAPHPEGIGAAVRAAHDRAGVQPEEIDLVMLHGSGTPRNDQTEARVMTEVFRGVKTSPLMTAIKSMTGHTLGGSGLLSLIMAVAALDRGVVPPVRGLVEPIEEAAGLRLVRDRCAVERMTTAQVNAFGFGGINAVAILEVA
jgi:3-oxoacyl-(acyl-carrier-protein) synthase